MSYNLTSESGERPESAAWRSAAAQLALSHSPLSKCHSLSAAMECTAECVCVCTGVGDGWMEGSLLGIFFLVGVQKVTLKRTLLFSGSSQMISDQFTI